MSENNQGATAPSTTIDVVEVIALLSEGKSRIEIAKHFGVPASVMKEVVWSRPELKGKKAKKQYHINVVDSSLAHTVGEQVEENPVMQTETMPELDVAPPQNSEEAGDEAEVGISSWNSEEEN